MSLGGTDISKLPSFLSLPLYLVKQGDLTAWTKKVGRKQNLWRGGVGGWGQSLEGGPEWVTRLSSWSRGNSYNLLASDWSPDNI